MAGDKLPKDAEIAGVAVGGLSTEAAVEKLQAQLGEQAAAPIAVTAGDEKAEVSPSDAGLSVDYAASVELAGGGRSLDPRHIWRVLTGGSQTDAVVVTDQAELDAAVAELAKNVDREPKDAKLSFDGDQVVQTKGKDGVALDADRGIVGHRERVPDLERAGGAARGGDRAGDHHGRGGRAGDLVREACRVRSGDLEGRCRRQLQGDRRHDR